MPAKVVRSAAPPLPDHTQLPDQDRTIAHNPQEDKQSLLLTECLEPALDRLHPDGHYFIGQRSTIYWWLRGHSEPPILAAVAPDWFYAQSASAIPEDKMLPSPFFWLENVPPLILLEFVSRDGSEERDRTPYTGMFWIYEQEVRAPYYGIYEPELGRLDMHRLVKSHYRRQRPNSRGHYLIKPLGVELGLWKGRFLNKTMAWLRWFDRQGRLLPYGRDEARQERWEKELAQRRAELAMRQVEQERQARERAEQKVQRLAEQLRALGAEPGG